MPAFGGLFIDPPGGPLSCLSFRWGQAHNCTCAVGYVLNVWCGFYRCTPQASDNGCPPCTVANMSDCSLAPRPVCLPSPHCPTPSPTAPPHRNTTTPAPTSAAPHHSPTSPTPRHNTTTPAPHHSPTSPAPHHSPTSPHHNTTTPTPTMAPNHHPTSPAPHHQPTTPAPHRNTTTPAPSTMVPTAPNLPPTSDPKTHGGGASVGDVAGAACGVVLLLLAGTAWAMRRRVWAQGRSSNMTVLHNAAFHYETDVDSDGLALPHAEHTNTYEADC